MACSAKRSWKAVIKGSENTYYTVLDSPFSFAHNAVQSPYHICIVEYIWDGSSLDSIGMSH